MHTRARRPREDTDNLGDLANAQLDGDQSIDAHEPQDSTGARVLIVHDDHGATRCTGTGKTLLGALREHHLDSEMRPGESDEEPAQFLLAELGEVDRRDGGPRRPRMRNACSYCCILLISHLPPAVIAGSTAQSVSRSF